MSHEPKEQFTDPELNQADDNAMDNPTSNDESLDQDAVDAQHQQAGADLQETVDLEELFKKSHEMPSNDERVLEAERQVLMVRAEMENFRKRMQRDAEQQLKYANIPLLRDLLDVVDNVNRAVDAAKTDTTNSQALLSGVEMVGQQMLSVLAKFGCKPVDAVGSEFDPHVHEAIAQMPSEEHAAGKVAQQVAVGYLLHDRVVRPSSVIVSTGPKQP